MLFVLLIPACLQAQNAPLTATTIVTTNTGTTSVCVGGNTIKAPTTCTGGLKSGTIASAGAGNSALNISVTNTTSGTAAQSSLTLVAGTTTGIMTAYSQGFTPSGYSIPSSVLLYSAGSAGIVSAANHATGTHRWFNLGTELMRLHPSGGLSLGNTVDPGAANVSVTGDVVAENLYAGTISIQSAATFTSGLFPGGAFGTGGITGAIVLVGPNSSGGGAAGLLNLQGKAAGSNFIWADASGTPGVLRISTAAPEEDGTPSDTSGTVVGAQSSTLDTKDILGPGLSPAEALATMLRTPTFRFVYKGGSYSGTQFTGIVTDWSPEFGMDPDAGHPNGRSFNPVNALGYTVQAIKALQAEIDELRATVQGLREAR